MRKRFFNEKAESVLDECAKIKAENRINRDQMLVRRDNFQKRFNESQIGRASCRERVSA